uniref:Alpha/beta hydrolase fold-3 domain-containing protein n=1 Tax=Oryza barthii TaxID=65489 RepID=A0A0D3H1B9_9ORYZ
MGEPDEEITFEFLSLIRCYRSGRVDRLLPDTRVPRSVDAATGVASRDVTIDPATGLWARLYLPDLDGGERKLLPVVVYLHGGGLVVGSAADALEHGFANRLCARARALVVSVDYRLAPELRDHGDRERVFVLGYSAGGNIAHNVTLRAGAEELPGGARVKGMALLHPYFMAAKKADGEVKNAWLRGKLEEMWALACGGGRTTAGLDDPRINPVADGAPSLRRLGCDRVLVCLADDELEVRGKDYYDGLLESGWAEDAAELLVSGEDHEYVHRDPDSAKAVVVMDRLAALFGGKN